MGKWREKKFGRAEEDVWPKCGEKEQTLDHIVFRCGKVRREWASENGMRWDKKWVRMEESGRAGDEGRPILERVDLIKAFLAGVHRQI